jgi:hypothetical protein
MRAKNLFFAIVVTMMLFGCNDSSYTSFCEEYKGNWQDTLYLGDTIRLRKQVVSVDSQICRIGSYQSNGRPLFGHAYYKRDKFYKVMDYINWDLELFDFINLFYEKYQIPKVDSSDFYGQPNAEYWVKDDLNCDLTKSRMILYKVDGDSVTISANYSEVSGSSWWMHIFLVDDEDYRYISENKTTVTFHVKDAKRLSTGELRIMCLVSYTNSNYDDCGYIYARPRTFQYFNSLAKESLEID